MKFLHLSDLHFGKALYSRSLIEDQAYWVEQILTHIDRTRPDAVVIAGDVYDRGVPAKEAIPLLTRLLTDIADKDIPVMLIAGNHDGGERLEFADELLKTRQVYIAGTVRRDMVHLTRDFGDGYGPVTFWLMPYTFPAAIREVLGAEEDAFPTYTDAVKALLAAQEIDPTTRNVLIAHQMVVCGGESPEIDRSCSAVGGVGCIDASAFDGFDYVALGHVHRAQKVGRSSIRYAGSPLCYHFDEWNQPKGPLTVTLGKKGSEVEIATDTLMPLHPVRQKMHGTLAEILETESRSDACGELVEVELTDDWVPPDTHEKLKALFASHGCELLHISRVLRAASPQAEDDNPSAGELPIDVFFLQFYRQQSDGQDPTREDLALIRHTADLIGHADAKDTAARLTQLILQQERDRA